MGSRALLRTAALCVALSGLAACTTPRGSQPTQVGDAPAPRRAAPDSASPPPAQREFLALNGTIDTTMLAAFQVAVAARDIRELRIASDKGNARDALMIAETVLARGIDVTITGHCLGVCTDIFIAGRRRRIEPGALVAFHSQPATLKSLSAAVDDDIPLRYQASMQGIVTTAADQERLYQQRGIALSLLHDQIEALRFNCVIFRRADPGMDEQARSLTINSGFAAWVPDRKTLASAGLTFEGFWPGSRREINRLTAAAPRSDPLRHLYFGSVDTQRLREQKQSSARKLRNCALEEESLPR